MTCNITDMPERTNIIPKMGINNILPLKIDTEAIIAPRPNDPVSPINTDALFVLKSRYPESTPHMIIHSVAKELSPCVIKIKLAIAAKYQKETEAASPSRPSVKLTQFVVAKNTKTIIGIIQKDRFRLMLVHGMRIKVRPFK